MTYATYDSIPNGMTRGPGLRDRPPDGAGDPCANPDCAACYAAGAHETCCMWCGKRWCLECEESMVRVEDMGLTCPTCAVCAVAGCTRVALIHSTAAWAEFSGDSGFRCEEHCE